MSKPSPEDLDKEFKIWDTKTKVELQVVGGGESWVVITDHRNKIIQGCPLLYNISWGLESNPYYLNARLEKTAIGASDCGRLKS